MLIILHFLRVVARVRPITAEEDKEEGLQLAVSSHNGFSMQVMDEKVGKGQVYDLSYCADCGCSQSQFFEDSGIKALLESVVEGYSATCFAYGQVKGIP
jgi:hypothetical protein